MHDHVNLFAGRGSSGADVMEAVAVERLSGQFVRILATPAIAHGVVLGDVVEIDGEGRATVVSRSGLVGIQVYLPAGGVTGMADELGRQLGRIGGRVEGGPPRVIVCHAPVTAGFGTIETAIDGAIGGVEGVEWMFTNVYADDGSQLGWWEAL